MILTQTIAHFFYPRYSNNHKAKLIHSSSLFVLGIFLILLQFFLQTVSYSGLRILGYAANIPPAEVINLTNQKRAESGLSALSYNETLAQAARAKGEHMLANNYWAHIAPDGTDPWKFFTDYGYNYKYAGENLARDFSNPQSAVDAWMASPSHKENILSAKYREIGIAVVEGDLAGVDTTIIVQLFGTRLSESPTQATIAQAQTEVSPTPVVVTPTPTLLPTSTPMPTQAPFVITQITPPMESNLINSSGENQTFDSNGGFNVLVSPFDTTRGVSLITIVLLLSVMVIDGIIASKKKIPRIGGRTFAHLAFLATILVIIIVARAGSIL